MLKFRVGWVRPLCGGFRREFSPMTEPMESDAKVHEELRIRGYWDSLTKHPRRGYSVLILDEGVTPWCKVSS